MKNLKYHEGISEICRGLLVWLLFLPEAILFFIIGTEIRNSYLGIGLFFLLTILLYNAVPIAIENRLKKVQLPQSKLTVTKMPILIACATVLLKVCLL